MKSLILVDFDKTLSCNDTTKVLILSLLRSKPFSIFKILYYCVKIKKSSGFDMQRWKNCAIGELINRQLYDRILISLNSYRKTIKSYLRKDILSRLLKYSIEGKHVIVVTASPSFAVAYWLKDYPFSVIGTEFMMDNNVFSKKTLSPICFGQGKVHKISEWVKENVKEPFTYLESWSDELSDYPMMELSKKKVWVCSEKKKKELESYFVDAEYFLC